LVYAGVAFLRIAGVLSWIPIFLDGDFLQFCKRFSLALDHAIKEGLNQWCLSNLVVASWSNSMPPFNHFFNVLKYDLF